MHLYLKTQKYESNDLLKKTRYEGYKAWQLGASYAPEKNIGINAYYGFHAKTQDGNRVNDFYRADLKLQILVSNFRMVSGFNN